MMKRIAILLLLAALLIPAGALLAMESAHHRLAWFTPLTGSGRRCRHVHELCRQSHRRSERHRHGLQHGDVGLPGLLVRRVDRRKTPSPGGAGTPARRGSDGWYLQRSVLEQ